MNVSGKDKQVHCSVDCTSDAFPDACGNDIREERLIQRQTRQHTQPWILFFINRERYLFVAVLALMFLMNFSTGRYVLYPFKIFSTWVHEMCHGMAAILSGGYIAKLQIFPDGSGLATTASQHRGFVAAAGYPGTSVTGGLLLLFRRTTLGPTIGTLGLGFALLLSVVLYVRNDWGMIALSMEGVFLLLCGWKLPAAILDHLYSFLALTVSMNAIENIHDLYGSDEGYVNGELRNTDAHTVAEVRGGDYRMWATKWLCLSIAMTVAGIFLARDARALPWSDNKNQYHTGNNSVTTNAVSHHSHSNHGNNGNNNIPQTSYVAMPSSQSERVYEAVAIPVATSVATYPAPSAPTEAQLRAPVAKPMYAVHTV